MADAPKLVGTDRLKDAYPKINLAIDNANQALSTSNNAETTANSVQEQFNEVVLEGAIDPETAQARVDENGVTKTTLKERIDEGFVKATTHLSDITTLSSKYSTLQQAFDNTLPSKTITVPSGEYQLNESLVFRGGKRYIGYGVTIKAMVNTAYINTNENSIIIEGFTFDANNLLMEAFLSYDNNNVRFINCKFNNATKYGLHFRNAKQSSAGSCQGVNNGRRDFMSSSFAANGEDIVFANCEANDNTLGNGFMCYGDTNLATDNVSYLNCRANKNYNHGFLTNSLNGYTNKPTDIKYTDCKANENGHGGVFSGFALHYVDQAKMKGCTANNNQEHGIVLMDGNEFSITQSTAKFNKYSGIRLQSDWIRAQDSQSGVKNSIISDNIVTNNGSYAAQEVGKDHLHNGILIEGNCHYIDINNNQVINNDGRSVFVKSVVGYNDCTNIYINDNTIFGNTMGNDILKTVITTSIYGTNRIAGALKAIRAEESDELYTNIDLNTIVASGGTITGLKVTPNALYRCLTGETFTLASLDGTSYPAGTKFFLAFQSSSSTGGITVQAGTGISLPDTQTPFVIDKANARHMKIYEFVKVSGSSFVLKG
jgi:hypothetical protein